MDNNKDDLIEEGTINFWIRLYQNPLFSDPNSNITFMNRKPAGKLFLTMLKELSVLHVKIENPKYGVSESFYNIMDYLNKDLMVTLVWKKGVSKLYLNANVAEETEIR